MPFHDFNEGVLVEEVSRGQLNPIEKVRDPVIRPR
jgi:hypothetical protein